METPSSTARRVTRSQTKAASNNNNNIPISRKIEDSEKSAAKSRKRTPNNEKQPLIDITNDSPIVGLASGNLETPSSKIIGKQKSFRCSTPGSGSGETLLRGQVKSLLQRVEEEAILSKLSEENRPFINLINSPMRLIAPTPANTPQILDLVDKNLNGLESINPSPVGQELEISQLFQMDTIESDKNLTRSLLFDFSEKLEFSNSSSSSDCPSVVTQEGSAQSNEKSSTPDDDDDCSVWSIQVNASSTHDEDEETITEEEEDADELIDMLCEGVSKMSMVGAGKHIRFKYNSDDEEIVEEEEESSSPGVLRLQGLPTPKGKHLRFSADE